MDKNSQMHHGTKCAKSTIMNEHSESSDVDDLVLRPTVKGWLETHSSVELHVAVMTPQMSQRLATVQYTNVAWSPVRHVNRLWVKKLHPFCF